MSCGDTETRRGFFRAAGVVGASTDFAVHLSWLPAGRWGVEAIANLDAAPATGATLIVGSPKVEGCTGGPTRLFALA